MKKTTLAILVTLCGTAFAGGSSLTPGLWEMKLISQVVDGRDMTAQMAASQSRMQKMMANMPPAQRARMESMLRRGNMSAPGNPSSTFRVCISPEMAARNTPVVDSKGRCKPSNLNHTGNTTRFEFSCGRKGQTEVGKGELRVNGDKVDSSMDMTMTDARGHHTIHTESQMRFLGSDCQGIKPLDQLASESKARGR